MSSTLPRLSLPGMTFSLPTADPCLLLLLTDWPSVVVSFCDGRRRLLELLGCDDEGGGAGIAAACGRGGGVFSLRACCLSPSFVFRLNGHRDRIT